MSLLNVLLVAQRVIDKGPFSAEANPFMTSVKDEIESFDKMLPLKQYDAVCLRT